jgi:hypothetical protein
MKHLINILWIGTCLFLSLSCSKNAVDLKDSEFGFDPIAEPSATLRNLHVNAIFFEEEPPVSDTANGRNWFIIPPTDSIDTYEGTTMDLRFNIKNIPIGYSVRHFLLKLPGSLGYWEVRTLGSGAPQGFNLLVPKTVRPGMLKLQISAKVARVVGGAVLDSFYTQSVEKVVNVLSPQNCGFSLTGRNRKDIIYRKINLPDRDGKLKIRFFTIDSASGNKTGDRFDVRYNARYILSSAPAKVDPNFIPGCGGLNTGAQKLQGWKEYTVDFKSAEGRTMELFVQGNCSDTTKGTSWRLEFGCPE